MKVWLACRVLPSLSALSATKVIWSHPFQLKFLSITFISVASVFKSLTPYLSQPPLVSGKQEDFHFLHLLPASLWFPSTEEPVYTEQYWSYTGLPTGMKMWLVNVTKILKGKIEKEGRALFSLAFIFCFPLTSAPCNLQAVTVCTSFSCRGYASFGKGFHKDTSNIKISLDPLVFLTALPDCPTKSEKNIFLTLKSKVLHYHVMKGNRLIAKEKCWL